MLSCDFVRLEQLVRESCSFVRAYQAKLRDLAKVDVTWVRLVKDVRLLEGFGLRGLVSIHMMVLLGLRLVLLGSGELGGVVGGAGALGRAYLAVVDGGAFYFLVIA